MSIPDWLTGGGATSEADTERDGFLSYSGEVHAVAIGTIFAVLFVLTGVEAIPVFFALLIMGKAKVSSGHLKDAAKEVGYSGGAFVVVWTVLDLLPSIL